MEAVVPSKQTELKDLKAKFGDRSLGEVTVKQVSDAVLPYQLCQVCQTLFNLQVIGGMRGIPGILTETSLLDPEHV